MQITLNIPADRIANMMCSAVESGDPVTNGWCLGIEAAGLAIKRVKKGDHWYASTEYFDGEFTFVVKELLDESKAATGRNVKEHRRNQADVAKGLTVMAKKYPHIFRLVLEDNTDAPCADLFLQCVLFGEEKYA